MSKLKYTPHSTLTTTGKKIFRRDVSINFPLGVDAYPVRHRLHCSKCLVEVKDQQARFVK